MTVAELIEKLKAMPQEMDVWTPGCGGHNCDEHPLEEVRVGELAPPVPHTPVVMLSEW